jgi:general bacterial porin, GBP family
VTISGVLDAGYRSVSGPLNTDTKGAFQNGTATSAIFVKGTEDLGSGLTASFQYEMNPDFVSGSGLSGNALASSDGLTTNTAGTEPYVRTSNGANGNNFVGLTSASLGGIKFGRLNTSTLAAWGTGSVFGTALGSGYSSNGNVLTGYSSSAANFAQSAPTRINNSVEYTSPTIAGFTARVLMAPKVDNTAASGGENSASLATLPGANRQGVTDLGLGYSQGPLNVQFAQQTTKHGANAMNALVTTGVAAEASTTHKLTTLAANYTVGAVKVLGAVWTEKHDRATASNDVDAKGTMIGVQYTMGKIDLKASQAKRDNRAASNNVDKKVTGVGADYNFSKRTAAWVRYENRDADTNVATDAVASGVTKTTAVGIRHNF